MVPGEGIEPPTFGLQNRCTTAVLTRRLDRVFLSHHRGHFTRISLICDPITTEGPGKTRQRRRVDTPSRAVLQARNGDDAPRQARLRLATRSPSKPAQMRPKEAGSGIGPTCSVKLSALPFVTLPQVQT